MSVCPTLSHFRRCKTVRDLNQDLGCTAPMGRSRVHANESNTHELAAIKTLTLLERPSYARIDHLAFMDPHILRPKSLPVLIFVSSTKGLRGLGEQWENCYNRSHFAKGTTIDLSSSFSQWKIWQNKSLNH